MLCPRQPVPTLRLPQLRLGSHAPQRRLDDCLANDIPPLLRPLSLGPADLELDGRSLPPARSRPAHAGDEQESESARAPWSGDGAICDPCLSACFLVPAAPLRVTAS